MVLTAITGDNTSTIQSAINANPAGTIFYFDAGTYRLEGSTYPSNEGLIAKNNDVFVGACGAILNGSVLLTSFTSGSGYYEATGVPVSSQNDTRTGMCDNTHLLCNQDQDLYYDNVPLVPVSSVSALKTGTWYFDRTRGNAYLYDNPSGHTVELSIAVAAFGNTNQSVGGITISGLTIEKFSPENQNGAVGDQYPGSDWLVENNEILLNHGAGVNLGSGGTAQGNYIHNNGQMAGTSCGDCSGAQFINNESTANNYAGYNIADGTGGYKFGAVINVNMIGNYIHDDINSYGPSTGNDGAQGIWFDVDSGELTGGVPGPILMKNNVVVNEGGPALVCEISHYCTITDNVATNDGYSNTWGFAGAIRSDESDHVTVNGNVVTLGVATNQIGIDGIQQSRGNSSVTGKPYQITDFSSTSNIVILAADGQIATGFWTDDGDTSIFTSNANIFSSNAYKGLTYNADAFQWIDGTIDSATWQSFNNDPNGTFNQ